MTKKNDFIYLCVSFITIFLVVYHWWHPGFVIAAGDNFFGFNPLVQVQKGFLGWNRSNLYLGGPSSSGAITGWWLILGVLTRWLGSSSAQFVVFLAMVYCTFAGMYWYLRLLRFNTAISAICAFGYIFNPWNELFFGTNYPLNMLVLLVPWYAVGAILGFQRFRLQKTLLVCFGLLSLTLLGIIGANPALILLFLFGALFLASVGTNDFWKSVWLRRFIIVNTCASLWWVFLVIYYFVDAKIVAAGATDFLFVVQRASLLNVLRLNPIWGWVHPEYFPYAERYDSQVITYAASFLWAVAATLVPLSATGPRKNRMLLALIVFLVSAFFSKGLHPPLEFINRMFYTIPGSGLFREPTSKFELFTVWSGIILLACVSETAVQRLRLVAARTRSFYRGGFYAFILIVTMCSAQPALSGEIFFGSTPNYHENVPGLPSRYIRLPRYWSTLAEYLRAASPGGIVTYPVDAYYQDDYRWGYYGVDEISGWFLPNDVLTTGLEGYVSTDMASSISQWLERATMYHSPLVGKVLRSIGIRYVLYRGDVLHDNSLQEYVSASDVAATFPEAKRKEFGELTLYDLGNVAPEVSIVPRWYATNAFGNPINELELGALDDEVPRVVESQCCLPAAPAAFENNMGQPGVKLYSQQHEKLRFVAFNGTVSSQRLRDESIRHNEVLARWVLVNTPALNMRGIPREKDVPLSKLMPAATRPGKEEIQILTSVTIDGAMDIEVFNPFVAEIPKNVVVGVPVINSGGYILYEKRLQRNTVYRAEVIGRLDDVETLRFENINLSPGINLLHITPSGLSPRNVFKNKAIISRIGVAYVESPNYSGSQCATGAGCAGHFLGELPLNARMDDIQFLNLQPGDNPQRLGRLLARFDFQKDNRSLSCFASFSPTGIEPAQLYQACIDNPLADVSEATVMLHDVAFYDALPIASSIKPSPTAFETIRIFCSDEAIPPKTKCTDFEKNGLLKYPLVARGDGFPRDRYYSTFEVSNSPKATSEVTPLAGQFGNAFIRLFHPQGSGTKLLVLNQSFDRTWILLQPEWPLVRLHVVVDGWENGWFVDLEKPIVIVQSISVLQIVLILFGVFAIARGWYVG